MSQGTISDRDLIWAALIFEEKGKLHAAGKKVYLQVNSRQTKDLVPRLIRLFGGKSYGFGDMVNRWQIGGEELFTFIERIRPHLTPDGTALASRIIELQNALSGTKASPTTPTPRVDAFNLLEGVDEDQIDLLTVAWDTFPMDDHGRVILRTHGREHTLEWSTTLIARGFIIEVQGDSLIYVNRRISDRRSAAAQAGA